MARFAGVLTYSSSPDFRPDVDALNPVQASIPSLAAREAPVPG